ncbi:Uncharacterized protein OBRU01_03636, partial [Operophtera brumata]
TEYLEPDSEWSRVRRQAEETTTTSSPQEEEKPAKALPKYALYNATGPPGKGALLFSSGWPELRFANGSSTVLSTPVGEPTVKPTRLYTILMVRFADGDSRNKTTLEFSFKQSGGWWTAVGVEVKFGLEITGLSLTAPGPPDAPSAVLGKSYHCPLPLVYSSEEATLTLPDVQVILVESESGPPDAPSAVLGKSYHCPLPLVYSSEEATLTLPDVQVILSGLLVTFIMLIGIAISITMIMDIRTMDRFETSRSKQLTITVNE